MLEFVKELLNSHDNIIDQLIALKENKNHKEVKKYIKEMLKSNYSPYYQYCIDKYLFDKDVAEVKPKAPRFISGLCPKEELIPLLDACDDYIDQLKLLSKYRDDKKIEDYVIRQLQHFEAPYFVYCTDKYFYGKDVNEVEATAKTMGITLINLDILTSLEEKNAEKISKNIRKVKVGDRVMLQDGPFKDIMATVNLVDKLNNEITVTITIFDETFSCEHNGSFKIIKEEQNAREN